MSANLYHIPGAAISAAEPSPKGAGFVPQDVPQTVAEVLAERTADDKPISAQVKTNFTRNGVL